MILFVVLLSPFLVAEAFGAQTTWLDLANIGQAYGGAAALISAFALIGITASLILQRRQARASTHFRRSRTSL